MKREVWLDYLRVLACLMVMVIHSTEPFYLGGEGALILTPTDAFWVAIFEALCRCCGDALRGRFFRLASDGNAAGTVSRFLRRGKRGGVPTLP